MLLSFTLGNFLSFKEPVMLSMKPVRGLKDGDTAETHLINTEHSEIKSLLKSAAIYGANASGKSNLLIGLMEMRKTVLESLLDIRPDRESIIQPFAFSEETVSEPTLFEVRILLRKHIYRYGFEVRNRVIEAEWLYRDEEELFMREKQDISVEKSFPEGEGKEAQVRPEVPFLSVCHFLNGKISTEIIQDFFQQILWAGNHPRIIREALGDEKISERLLDLIKLADPGIRKFQRADKKREVFNRETGKYETKDVSVYEAVFECDGSQASLALEYLSSGTLRLITSASQILNSLDNGGIVIIDEIDIQLHPLLVESLLNYFHSQNSSKAQLIFTTHNTFPLRQKMLRRDQVWFLNKQLDLSSQLVNFAEFKVPDDASYEKDYLAGRYGGIPMLDLPEIFTSYKESKKGRKVKK